MSYFVLERDVVSAEGPDAVAYLQGQISQDVESLAVGDSAWSLILQPQGKVDAWFRITRTGDDSFLLDVDQGYGEVLLARLKRFLMRVKVEFSLDTWTWHAIRGSQEPETLPDGIAIVAPPARGQVGIDLINPTMPERLDPPGDIAEFERLRIEAGVPKMGHELNEGTIPAEAGIVDESASFTKGCYTGQELVARVDSRGGNTPRRLRAIAGSGEVPAERTLTVDGNEAGVVTSIAPSADGWVGLAYVKRSALDHDVLELAGAPVTVHVPVEAS